MDSKLARCPNFVGVLQQNPANIGSGLKPLATQTPAPIYTLFAIGGFALISPANSGPHMAASSSGRLEKFLPSFLIG